MYGYTVHRHSRSVQRGSEVRQAQIDQIVAKEDEKENDDEKVERCHLNER